MDAESPPPGGMQYGQKAQPNYYYNYELAAASPTLSSSPKNGSKESPPLFRNWQVNGKIRKENFFYPSLTLEALDSPSPKKVGSLPPLSEDSSFSPSPDKEDYLSRLRQKKKKANEKVGEKEYTGDLRWRVSIPHDTDEGGANSPDKILRGGKNAYSIGPNGVTGNLREFNEDAAELALRNTLKRTLNIERHLAAKAKLEAKSKAGNLLLRDSAQRKEKQGNNRNQGKRGSTVGLFNTSMDLLRIKAHVKDDVNTPYKLYSKMVNSFDDKKTAALLNKTVTAEGRVLGNHLESMKEISTDEEVYVRQKVSLEQLVDEEDYDVFRGLLYYRIHNELNTELKDCTESGSVSSEHTHNKLAAELYTLDKAKYPVASETLESSLPLSPFDSEGYERKVRAMADGTHLHRVDRGAAYLSADIGAFGPDEEDLVQLSDRFYTMQMRNAREVRQLQHAIEMSDKSKGNGKKKRDDASGDASPDKELAKYSTAKSVRVQGSGRGQKNATDIEPPLELKLINARTRQIAQDNLLLRQLDRALLPERLLKFSSEDLKARALMNISSAEKKEKVESFDEKIVAEDAMQREAEKNLYMVNLSNYGIGDQQGCSLGESLKSVDFLQKLCLSGNRLTKKSVPIIVGNLSTQNLSWIDLSGNKLGDPKHVCAKALKTYFQNKNVCKHLNISNSGFNSIHLKVLCEGLSAVPYQVLEELVLSSNKIDEHGVKPLADYICKVMTTDIDPDCEVKGTLGKAICTLKSVDLSWNSVQAPGARHLAAAVRASETIQSIDLSANAIDDKGAQELGESLRHTTSLNKLVLAQNSVSSPSCFVFSRVLRGHPSMKVLDLSNNPVGEPGARAIFRTILKGLKCFVVMRECTFALDDTMFKHSNPAWDSPYNLDLSSPYQHAVLSELADLAEQAPDYNGLYNISYMPPKGTTEALAFNAKDPNAVKGFQKAGQAWSIPREGEVSIEVRRRERIPGLQDAIKDSALGILIIIIVVAKTEEDRRNWLRLLCCDLYCTTRQAQRIIDSFIEKQTIGLGGLRTYDVVMAVWGNILDEHNKYDFLIKNLPDEQEQKTMIHSMHQDIFKFSWSNPSGHWRFHLNNPIHRLCMMKFITINTLESNYSERRSGREDTSQNGDWSNFRNSHYTDSNGEEVGNVGVSTLEEEEDGEEGSPTITDNTPIQFILNKEFLDNLPYSGTLEFDYVSTRRPAQDWEQNKEFYDLVDIDVIQAKESQKRNHHQDAQGAEGEVQQYEEDQSTLELAAVNADPHSHIAANKAPPDGEKAETMIDTSSESAIFVPPSSSSPARTDKRLEAYKGYKAGRAISDSQLYDFLRGMGLSSRERCLPPNTVIKLLFLQHAVTKYFFTCKQAVQVLDTFSREPRVQAMVAVCIFARLSDLHNFDVILKALHSAESHREVTNRLGYLNVMNPMKPAFDYQIDMLYLDERRMLVSLLELAPSEAHDQIRDDLRTDISIVDLYGSLSRVLKNRSEQMVRFNYGEIGERSTAASWNLRTDYLKRFLVGTKPIEREVYRVIYMYNKLNKAGVLSRGSIEVQYATMQRKLAKDRGDEIRVKGKPESKTHKSTNEKNAY